MRGNAWARRKNGAGIRAAFFGPFERAVATEGDLVDWGVVPTMIEGQSRTSGKRLYKAPEGRSECGIRVCTVHETVRRVYMIR